eukprot:m.11335 g.11335  ORF g.11335 m.11335 type:complete len:284 (-) comp5697_c0_seq2:279-1130(-)
MAQQQMFVQAAVVLCTDPTPSRKQAFHAVGLEPTFIQALQVQYESVSTEQLDGIIDALKQPSKALVFTSVHAVRGIANALDTSPEHELSRLSDLQAFPCNVFTVGQQTSKAVAELLGLIAQSTSASNAADLGAEILTDFPQVTSVLFCCCPARRPELLTVLEAQVNVEEIYCYSTQPRSIEAVGDDLSATLDQTPTAKYLVLAVFSPRGAEPCLKALSLRLSHLQDHVELTLPVHLISFGPTTGAEVQQMLQQHGLGKDKVEHFVLETPSMQALAAKVVALTR